MKEERVQELLDIVKNNYQAIATEFDLTRQKALWPEILKLASVVKAGDTVLDLACGNGRLLEAWQGIKIDYLGVDNSEKLISLARKNYPEYNFQVGDMLGLDKVTATDFKFIFCLAALQHIPSKKLRVQALRLMGDKLCSNGQIVVSNWNLWNNPKQRLKLILSYLKSLFGFNRFKWNDLIFPWKNSQGVIVSQRYYHAFTKTELKRLAQLAGLKVVSLYKDKYNFWLILTKE